MNLVDESCAAGSLMQRYKMRAAIAVAMMLACSSSALAQDPFQSAPAPAPAPVVRSPPPPRVQAPRPQRPVYRRESEPEPAAAIPQSAPAPPIAQAPSPPEPPSLAGKWKGTNNCPIPGQWEWSIVSVGREQYNVTEPKNSSASGWVSGKLMHVQATGLLGEQLSWDGAIDSPTTMSGKIHVIFGVTCDWWAKKS